jgi:hypothetical protein
MKFKDIIDDLEQGKRIKLNEWSDGYYVWFNNEHCDHEPRLMIHNPNGSTFPWVFPDVLLFSEDWELYEDQ